MTAYYYKDEAGRVQQINLNPVEYHEEAKKHKLYSTKKEAKKGGKK